MTTKNAIILAAGEAKRLHPFSYTNPKCFVTVHNRTILENTLDNLSMVGVKTVHIVVGHLAELIKNKIGTQYKGMEIKYIENPIYQLTNSMYSLFLGLNEVNGATWIIEGDIFFKSDVISKNATGDFFWFVDSSIRDMDGAFIEIDNQNKAVSLKIIRDLSQITPHMCKSTGILHISDNDVLLVKKWLKSGVTQNKQNLYYDLIFAEHLLETTIKTIDISGLKWYEIDTFKDLEIAEKIFS
jgi:L-glutamine-phosphate cytidylyltransferase